jgi:hypothetical protein
MNRDEIIRMAREAGLNEDDGVWYSRSDVDADVTTDDLERFATLVAAAEREACARDAERFLLMSSGAVWEPKHFCEGIAAAIRARGE